MSPTEVVLSDGSHWRGSRRPLPWSRRGEWRRGDPVRVLRVRGTTEGEDYLLVNASRRCRMPDAGGAFTESRMHAAWLGRAEAPPRRGLLGWLGG